MGSSCYSKCWFVAWAVRPATSGYRIVEEGYWSLEKRAWSETKWFREDHEVNQLEDRGLQ